jgi:hypothetical protein
MKNKTIYSFLVATLLLFALSGISTQALVITLEWDSSLTIGTEISWNIVDMYLFNVSEPAKLAHEPLHMGDSFTFKINDTIPTDYFDVYETNYPPTFIQLMLHYHEISFFDIEEDPGFALQYLILPEKTYFDAIESNITEFLDFRTSRDPNVTSFSFYEMGDYIVASIGSDYLDFLTVTINSETGIAKEVYVQDDFGWFTAEINIWESTIDDNGTTINNVLDWHSSLVTPLTLAYQYTVMDFYDPGAYMNISGHNVTVGDVWKFKFTDLPIDPLELYGPELPNFLQVYLNDDLLGWEDMMPPQRVSYSTIINPLGLTMFNGTYYDMETIHWIRYQMDQEITSLAISYSGDYMFLDMIVEWQEWYEDQSYTSSVNYEFKINSITGILKSIHFTITNMGYFEMELNATLSDIDDTGTVFTPEPTNGTFSIPGYTALIALLAILAVIPIYRKKK